MFERLIEIVLKRPHLRVMSRIPGQCERDWLHIPRASAQPVKNVPVVPRSLPKVQSGEVPILSNGSMVPWAYGITQ